MKIPSRSVVMVVAASAVILLSACKQSAPSQEPAVEVAAPAEEAPSPVDAQPASAGADTLRKLSEAEVTEALSPSTFCNVEFLDGQLFSGQDLKAGGGVEATVSGWVGDEVTKGLPTNPMLRFEKADDKTQVWEVPLNLGLKREDVAAALSSPGVVDAGFSRKFQTSELGAGRYHVLLTYQATGKWYGCDSGRYAIFGGIATSP